jgi:hypothetical protein
MPITLLDILDTSVKIGLGAIISGIVTYKVTALSHSGELRKLYWTRRIEAIEKASEAAEDYFNKWLRFASQVGGFLKSSKGLAVELPPSVKEELKRLDVEYRQASENRRHVVAKLRLLGAFDAADKLIEVQNLVSEFRNDILLHNNIPTYDKHKELLEQIRHNMMDFHKMMSEQYQKLGSIIEA